MTPRWWAALLWGAIGALTFLVLHGAYLLAGGTSFGVARIAGVTLLVFVATAIASDYFERRLGGVERGEDGAP